MSEQIDQLKGIIGSAKNIVFFGGAGVSTESGIPDFRSETGLYQARSEYGRPPEYLLSYTCFKRDPELFFEYTRKNLIKADVLPNPAHYALTELEQRGVLKAIVTQNVDGLHQKAGSRVVHELHGSMDRQYCVDCGATYDLAYVLDESHNQKPDAGLQPSAGLKPSAGLQSSAELQPSARFQPSAGLQPSAIPRCEACGGIVRPDVVLYEEALDRTVMNAAAAAIKTADTLIVGGTSLVVYPAASFVDLFRGRNLVIINRDETDRDQRAALVIRQSIGEVLSQAVFGADARL